MLATLASAGLAGCNDAGSADPEAAVTGEPSPTPEADSAPQTFADTAWRSTAEDGARYTTYLDADGTYRDIRNGDPWQTGSWAYRDGEDKPQLCFTPDAENGVERCWEPGRMSDGAMRAKNQTGREIELERVDYFPPAAEQLEETDDAPA